MKREILFRGKRVDNGEWVLGYLVINKDETCWIKNTDYQVNNYKIDLIPHKVIPETIGQFTGLTDKNGVKIFEGDILLSESWGSNAKSKRKSHIVEWGKIEWVASGYNGDLSIRPSLDVKSDWQIIGNIHDNH